MSEFEIKPLDEWFRNGPDGSVRFNDPVFGREYAPDMPPDFLLEDDALWTGYERFRTELGEVSVALWLADNDKTVAALDQHGPMSFEQAVTLYPATGYVAEGRSYVGEKMRVGEAIADFQDHGIAPASTGDPYLDRITQAIVDADNPHYYAGVETVHGEMVGPSERVLAVMRDQVQMMRKSSSQATRNQAEAVDLHRRITEEWYHTLRAGVALGELSMTVRTKDREVLENSLLVVDVAKIDMMRKMEEAGIASAGFVEQVPAMHDPDFMQDIDIIQNARIPAEQL